MESKNSASTSSRISLIGRPTWAMVIVVDVRIVIWENADVLKVPASALFRVGAAWNVFVLESGLARLRNVEFGYRNALEVEIKSGLREGNKVVLHPSNGIKDGVAVKPHASER